MLENEYQFRTAIKDELVSNFDRITDWQYPEDYLNEMADGFVPVYNHEIIEAWHKSMPHEFTDSWQEFGLPSSSVSEISIIGLMRIDLYQWLNSLTSELWDEIKEEREVA
jgi:hypothetical protein